MIKLIGENIIFNFYLKWIATIVTLSAALCTSFRIDPLNIYLLNTGSILWVIWSIRIRERSLITVNSGLLIIYFMGVWEKELREIYSNL